MTVRITITETTADTSDMIDLLRHVADLIEQGYTSGFHPGWSMDDDISLGRVVAPDPVVHRVTVDESTEPGDIKFKAFCEACDWCGERWHHADQYADITSYGAVLQTRADAAYGAALAEGQAHIEEMEN
jgi:hypothetical protein